MNNFSPIISCICITNERPDFLQRAIKCFLNQSYRNKQLVISYPESDQTTPKLIGDFYNSSDYNISLLKRGDDETVGNARNHAILKSKGSYICIWDDDDWYHPHRLFYQYESLQLEGRKLNASVLTSILLLDKITNEAYLSFSYCWENTLLCRKEIVMQNQYANRNKGEDTHIIKFLDGKKFLQDIPDKPYLYIYIFHGQNTWDHKHYQHLTNKSSLLDPTTTKKILDLITVNNNL